MEVQSKYELALSKYNTHLHDDEIMMKVELLNNGPVTICMDTKNKE